MRNSAYWRGLGERFGFIPFQSTGTGSVWFHAVSVGEVLSAIELIRRIRAARPDVDVFLSTATLAGRDTAEQRLTGLVSGIFYAPLDYISVVRRVLRRLRPAAVVVMETEIWPNLYREVKRAGTSLLIINGRISDRALPRYVKYRRFFQHALRWPDAIWVQSDQDAERYVLAGAPKDRVLAAGNLKYDFRPPAEIAPAIADFLDRVQPRQVWVAASTMPPAVAGDPDEDDVVIEAYRKIAREGLLLILAPRRPERFEEAARKLDAAGIRHVRRSQLPRVLELPGVLLLDSIGELAAVFAHADVVFMGGTLASRGGHNILEPAYFAKPVIVGPHMENFAEIAREFLDAGALVQIAGAEPLAVRTQELLQSPGEVGRKAWALAEAKRGVVDRAARRVIDAIEDGVPQPLRSWPARVVLTPLSWIWTAGNRWNLAKQRSQAQRLSTPVISVGGLTMGGTGKSPVVAHLAAKIDESAILTRGYRRRNSKTALIVHRGVGASVANTGDEAQLFVRRQIAHVGVGPDRYDVGSTIEQQLQPEWMLLDDGFQHVRLHRDLDIVLIDAENPWGGGVFPLGLRREPLEALERASLILFTRVPRGANMSGLEGEVRRYNATAPIFRSRMVPEPWIGASRKVGAFCGIGSPTAFWRTLEELGLEIVWREAFADHHSYNVADLQRVAREAQAAGGEVLVTTEKDWMNLPEGLKLPLTVECVRIGVEIENEAELLRLLRDVIEGAKA